MSSIAQSNSIYTTSGMASPSYYPAQPGHFAVGYPQDTWTYCIRKAQNGFVLKTDGHEYVFETLESLSKKLKEFEEKEKTK